MKPELRAPKPPPVTAVTVSTAGSERTMFTICVILSCIDWKDAVWSARMKPTRRPVSCCGKNPFGITMYRKTLSATAVASTPTISSGWRSAQPRLRA